MYFDLYNPNLMSISSAVSRKLRWSGKTENFRIIGGRGSVPADGNGYWIRILQVEENTKWYLFNP